MLKGLVNPTFLFTSFPPSLSLGMDQLSAMFSRFMSPEAIARAEADYHRDMSSQNKNLRVLPPDPIRETESQSSRFASTGIQDDDHFRTAFMEDILQNETPRFPPLERLPCANVEVDKYKTCPNPGTLACSACKLVSYCSKECQIFHWRIHKIVCKNKMRSDKWQPSYIIERRPASFLSDGGTSTVEEFSRDRKDRFSNGAALWGNMPAMDVINLSGNEKDASMDFSLAFVASGDLRHVMRTINALPPDYSGNLTLIMNDLSTPTVCRNILVLLILGAISDKVMAADIALHFWYSVFMPSEYCLRMSATLTSFLKHMTEKGPDFSEPLGPRSTLSVCIPSEGLECFRHFISQSISMSMAQDEYDRVRTAPSREDFRERMYSKLRPSHRVAFHEFRRFGILLPFGALNAHFNVPNLSLFSFGGEWLQTDYADPLHGWDIETVIKEGKAHGAREEDIYGCLYFYLSDQLRLFVERIQRFHISFKVLSFEACVLSHVILDDELAPIGIPASIRFDRIEVSNIMDSNYVGINDVLTSWAPLLTESNFATILGYFMNWVALCQPDGLASKADKGVITKLLDRLAKEGRLEKIKNKNSSLSSMPGDLLNIVIQLQDEMQAVYDNSQPFTKFLRKQRLDAILRKTGLLKKKTNTIVPHRIRAPLDGPQTALPEFPDDDSWYYNIQVPSHTWTERFVEFAR